MNIVTFIFDQVILVDKNFLLIILPADIMAEGSKRPPVDRGWAWMVLLASWSHSALAAMSYLSGVYTVIFLETFHQSVALTTWCSSLHASILSLSGELFQKIVNIF